MVGTQIFAGRRASWSRLVTQDAPQPMPAMVVADGSHRFLGRWCLLSSILGVLNVLSSRANVGNGCGSVPAQAAIE